MLLACRPISACLSAVATLLCLLLQPLDAAAHHEPDPRDDFTVREAMVPMRDGVKLFTLILVPKAATGPLPILLERTPYDCSRALSTSSTRLQVIRGSKYVGSGYIYVVQDIRGRFKSGGDFAMYRVPRGAFNKTGTDETTDAWDTIDWLIKNVPGHNGKVGIWGTSYPGWLVLAALREPHPALAAAVPANPVVDVWKADDWFHWGAFRISYAFDYIYTMETRRGTPVQYPYETRDLYSWLLPLGSAELLGRRLDGRHKMWARLLEQPSYGPYWRDCAADRWFAAPSRLVPTLHIHGLWDQEDIYGAPAAYAALERHDHDNRRNYFAIGPWYHGGHFDEGGTLGPLRFEEDTGTRFRQDVLLPFLNAFLKGDAAAGSTLAPVSAFLTGANRWQRMDAWPPASETQRLYLQPDGALAFSPPTVAAAHSEYIADPRKPVPNAPRPHLGFDYDIPDSISAWRRWLVEDQRFVDGRPDVLTWVSPPLTAPLTLRGPVVAKLFAETTGSDADWVVKLIDVSPDEDLPPQARSGYQLMISADIFRGRYRQSFDQPQPIPANSVQSYSIPLPVVNHTLLPGHRLMVQVQSTWFPLYDRNPQTYVPSIMRAPASAYQAQRHRIHHSAAAPTHLELLVDPAKR